MTNFEELKQNWQSQSGIPQDRFDQIERKVQGTSNLLRTTVFRRDVRESVASGIVIVAFFPGLFAAKNWVSWSGFAVEVIAGATIPFVLWWARKRSPAAAAAASFRDFVDVEIAFLQRQVLLLRMVTWWYLLPIYAGIVLITLGSGGRDWPMFLLAFCAVYLTIAGGLCVFVWWLNQSGLRNHMQPLLRYYMDLRAALDSGEDTAFSLSDPPSAFLRSKPPKAMSRRRRWAWIGAILVVTALSAGVGYVTMQQFDARTGKFVIVTAPVITLLMIVISGVWRRNARGAEDGQQRQEKDES